MTHMKSNRYRTFAAQILSSLVLMLMLVVCARQPSYLPAPQEGSSIVIDTSILEPEVPKFYSYRSQGKNVNYFVLRVQGKVLSFLDACASCYIHKRGYGYADGHVTCRACNLKFSVNQLEKGLGSCCPIRIDGRMENGKYLIPVATLENAADKF